MQGFWKSLVRLLRGGNTAGEPQSSVPPQAQSASNPVVREMARVGRGQERRDFMYAAYEKLCEHLTNQNIGYWSRNEDLSICADFRGEVGTYRLVARVDPEDNLFQVFGYSPVRVPKGSRPAIAEAVTRANCGLKVGKFEMDFDEGELRFQASQILLDENLDDDTIRRLMGTTMAMLNTYLPAILSIIYGNELPQDAVRHVEARPKKTEDETEGEGSGPTE